MIANPSDGKHGGQYVQYQCHSEENQVIVASLMGNYYTRHEQFSHKLCSQNLHFIIIFIFIHVQKSVYYVFQVF